MLLFFRRSRLPRSCDPFFQDQALIYSSARGNRVMQRVALLLRKAPSRIGHRLAQLIAIAAASLPEVGA
jgi:hypothetical protein